VLYEIAAAKSRRGRDIRQNENPVRAAPQARSGVSGEPSGLQLRVTFYRAMIRPLTQIKFVAE
jgi:hypothetical protein